MESFGSFRLTIQVAFCVLVFSQLNLYAQSATGGLRGTVRDSSSGVIAGANVTLVDEATSVETATVSNSAGLYSFPVVQPATYRLVIEATGFKKYSRSGLVISTQETPTADVALELGNVSDVVNVTSEVPLVETTNASTGQLISSDQLEDLPNMGRSPFNEAVKLAQNIVPGGDPKYNRMEDQTGSSQISIGGGPVQGNNYILDGISVSNTLNYAVIIPTVEAVGEVKVQINTYDAEIGRSGGGTFNVLLKSGTNQLHGTLLGNMWIQSLLANNFFNNAAGRSASGSPVRPIASQPYWNYAGSFSGPIVVPKLYNGKNKTFFLVAWEAYKQRQAVTSQLSVPTALEKAGNFSQSLAQKGGPQIIYDPLSTVLNADGSYTRTPFVNNIIPQARLNPVGLALASYYPAPGVAPSYYGAPDFTGSASPKARGRQFASKLDQEIKPWWRFGLSYLHYTSTEPLNAYFGADNLGTPQQTTFLRTVDATQANTTLTPTPTTVVYIRWGFNRFPQRTYAITSEGMDMTKLGFSPSLISQLPYIAFPAITMGDVSSYGGTANTVKVWYSRSFSASVSKSVGRHTIKSGFDFRTLHIDGATGVTSGAYTFSQSFSSQTPASTVAGTGASLASMLLGYPSAGSVVTSSHLADFVDYYGAFVQDDFRLNSKLTINAGLRFEHESGIQSLNNGLVTGFDENAVNPAQSLVNGITTKGVILFKGLNGAPNEATSPQAVKWAPRVGFAYALDQKTTVRGGYGLFWLPFTFDLYAPIGFSNSTQYVASNDGNATPANSLSNPFPTGILQPIGNTQGALTGIGGQSFTIYQQNAKPSYMQSYSFDIQRDLGKGFALSTGYAGSTTKHLIEGTATYNINQMPDQYLSLGAAALNAKVANPFFGTTAGVLSLASPTVTRAQLLLPYPQFGVISLAGADDNHALYHSVYLKVQKRLANSLTLLNTVVWSQNKDASNGGAGNMLNVQNLSRQDNYNSAAEYSLSTISSPWRWTSATTYQLPFGKGKPFLNKGGALNYIAGGWSVSAATTMQTGFPLAVTQVNQNSSIGASNQRPNATGAAAATSGDLESRLGSYLSPAAFSTAPQYTFGNVARTIGGRGPGIASSDLSVAKAIVYGEHLKGQFRLEAYNATNTPQFQVPNTTVGNPAFGTITSLWNFPRVIQIGVHLNF
jgi:hypothetical protein